MKAFLQVCDSDSEDERSARIMQQYYQDCEDEGESSRRPRKTRRNIPRDREGAGQRLFDDYFANPPLYPEDFFRRRFRMSRPLFLRIAQDILLYRLPDGTKPYYFEYFHQKPDACQRLGFTIYQRITAALRQLSSGNCPDTQDEYLKMSESSAALSLENFCMCVLDLYEEEYLRAPNSRDVARLYRAHEDRHGFVGMLGSIDCMHWDWLSCPVEWQGQFTRGDHKKPTIILEAVASYDLWIWHAFFGMAGSNNDINVLNQSPVFDSIKNGRAPHAPFTVNGNTYRNGYYLADGIYPSWSTFVKAYSAPTSEPRAKFKKFQESARKDVERAFGVLQKRFEILVRPGRPQEVNAMRRIMYTCVILHNMIVEDNGFKITGEEEEYIAETNNRDQFLRNRQRYSAAQDEVIRDSGLHTRLREDLTAHIWALPQHFRNNN